MAIESDISRKSQSWSLFYRALKLFIIRPGGSSSTAFSLKSSGARVLAREKRGLWHNGECLGNQDSFPNSLGKKAAPWAAEDAMLWKKPWVQVKEKIEQDRNNRVRTTRPIWAKARYICSVMPFSVPSPDLPLMSTFVLTILDKELAWIQSPTVLFTPRSQHRSAPPSRAMHSRSQDMMGL